MNPLKISIPKPCHESWDAMTPDSKGRFCASCEKTVVDFTGMKASEISDYFLANSGKKVCGRFETAQLQEAQPIISPKLLNKITRRPLSFRQMFIVALMACMGSTLFSCNRMVGEPAPLTGDTVVVPESANKTTHCDTIAYSSIKGKIDPAYDKQKIVAKDTIHFVMSDRSAITGAVAVYPGDTILPPPPSPIQGTYKAPNGIKDEIRIKKSRE